MSEYIHLVGAEEVQRAGYNISQAAEQMIRAAGMFDESINRLIQKMEEVTYRLEAIGKDGE